MFKNLLGLLMICMISNAAHAQGSISGQLTDSTTGEPLYLATITAFQAEDTVLISYKLSDKDGNFKITGLPLNLPLRIIASFTGYEVLRKEFTLTAENTDLNIGKLVMPPSGLELDEVLVIAERPPIVVKKDTVEFNASSFRTLPNAVVEDLLKKLPGVQIDKEGNITVNGRPVNRILVDGKTFFGSDPKMASRNLTANTIDKVQVTDDKEEMLRTGDDNPNNVGKVINLTFKKGFKKGVFGKAYAGYGTEDRYEAGAIANFFRDTLQFSVLGYTNNLNRPGFGYNDLMQTGGIGRNTDVTGNRNTSTNTSQYGSNIVVNGINFGGMNNQGGVSTSHGAGINLNHAPNNKQSIFGQYYFGKVRTDIDNTSENRITQVDSILVRSSIGNQALYSTAHSFAAGINLRPDSTTTFIATANYILGAENNSMFTGDTAFHNYTGALSSGTTDIIRDNETKNYSHFISYTKLSRSKKGRRFGIVHNLNTNNKDNRAFTDAFIDFYYPSRLDSFNHQLRREEIPLTAGNLFGNYTEPLAKNVNLKLGLRYEYEKMKNTTSTFWGEGYDVKMPRYSSEFLRTSNRGAGSAGLEFVIKELRITPTVKYQFQHFENDLSYLPKPINQEIGKLLPALGIIYKKLSINYERDIILPQYQYLIPVQNNSNPYYIQLGNPDLVPAIRDQVSINMNNYDAKRSINVWGWSRAALISNDVIQNITLDEKGVQTVLPQNADDTKSFQINAGVNKDYKFKSNFSMNWYLGTYTAYENKRFVYNNINGQQKSWRANWWAGFGLNWNDKFEWNNSFSIGNRSVKNSSEYFPSQNFTTGSIGTEFIMRWLKHVIFDTQLDYGYNGNIPGSTQRDYLLWNAGVSFTMLKDERGVLRLSAFDMLNQLNNVYVNVYQNMRNTTSTNVLNQYFMANFTYNIRPAGQKGKVGGQWKLW